MKQDGIQVSVGACSGRHLRIVFKKHKVLRKYLYHLYIFYFTLFSISIASIQTLQVYIGLVRNT